MLSGVAQGTLSVYRITTTQDQHTSFKLEKPKRLILAHPERYMPSVNMAKLQIATALAYMQNTFNWNHVEWNFQNNLFPQHFRRPILLFALN